MIIDLKILKIKLSYKHKAALTDTLAVAVWTIMPTIIGLLVYLVAGPIKYEKLYDNGDFILYAVSFLSSSSLIYNEQKYKKSDPRASIKNVIIWALLLLSVVFALLKAFPHLDLTFVFWTSLLSFTVGIIVFYSAQVIVNQTTPDIVEQRTGEQGLIEDNLE